MTAIFNGVTFRNPKIDQVEHTIIAISSCDNILRLDITMDDIPFY